MTAQHDDTRHTCPSRSGAACASPNLTGTRPFAKGRARGLGHPERLTANDTPQIKCFWQSLKYLIKLDPKIQTCVLCEDAKWRAFANLPNRTPVPRCNHRLIYWSTDCPFFTIIFVVDSVRYDMGVSRLRPLRSQAPIVSTYYDLTCTTWRFALERPTTIGAPPLLGPPPPPRTKVTIVGKNEIYGTENLIGPFLVHKLLGPSPPPRPPAPPVLSSILVLAWC